MVLTNSLRSDPILSLQVAEAEATMQTKLAEAQADVITKKGEAAAEVMELKADAWMSCAYSLASLTRSHSFLSRTLSYHIRIRHRIGHRLLP
jgi:hypothetical protein